MKDAELLATSDALRASLGIAKAVEIRESAAPGLPAAVGWLRPCVLLPPAWRGWSADERRVVLAHELAHIHRGDFARRLAGRACVIVHFYHPAAHWLSGRLRLQQELAADAWGIHLAGRATYLTTLARMALRLIDGREGPTRALPAFRGSFLRRLDMLCDDTRIGESPEPGIRRARWLAAGLVGLAAVAATALQIPRAPAADGDRPPAPADAPAAPKAAALAPFDLSHVPADAVAVAAFRPASILRHEDARSLLALARLDGGFGAGLERASRMGLAPEAIEQVILVQLGFEIVEDHDERSPLRRCALIVRSSTPIDIRAAEGAIKELDLGAKMSVSLLDERTAVAGSESAIRAVSGPSAGPRNWAWSEAWSGVERSQVAIAIDAAYLRRKADVWIDAQVAGTNNFDPELMLFTSPLAPIWEGARGISLGLNIEGEQVEVISVNAAETAEAAESTHDTVRALTTLARNSADSVRRRFRRPSSLAAGGVQMLMISKGIDLVAGPIFRQMRVEREGRSVRFATRFDLDTLLILSQFR